MNENQENNVVEEVKQETVKTFNEAKETIKKINLKEEAEVGKGLLKKLWKNPTHTIKEIADDKENKAFKTALLLVAVWAIVELVTMILYYATSKYIEFEFLPTLKATVAPIIKVIAMTLALYFVNNRAKDSISKLLTSVTITYIPSIISSLLWILYEISSKISTILTPLSGLLNAVSIVLMYNTVKAVTNEEENKAIKTFIKVEAVYYVILLAVSFLGISL